MRIHILTTLLLILISSRAFADGPIKITGYVRDADGSPLELVNVRVKNTLIGTLLFPFHITRRLHRDHLLMPWF